MFVWKCFFYFNKVKWSNLAAPHTDGFNQLTSPFFNPSPPLAKACLPPAALATRAAVTPQDWAAQVRNQMCKSIMLQFNKSVFLRYYVWMIGYIMWGTFHCLLKSRCKKCERNFRYLLWSHRNCGCGWSCSCLCSSFLFYYFSLFFLHRQSSFSISSFDIQSAPDVSVTASRWCYLFIVFLQTFTWSPPWARGELPVGFSALWRRTEDLLTSLSGA